MHRVKKQGKSNEDSWSTKYFDGDFVNNNNNALQHQLCTICLFLERTVRRQNFTESNCIKNRTAFCIVLL